MRYKIWRISQNTFSYKLFFLTSFKESKDFHRIISSRDVTRKRLSTRYVIKISRFSRKKTLKIIQFSRIWIIFDFSNFIDWAHRIVIDKSDVNAYVLTVYPRDSSLSLNKSNASKSFVLMRSMKYWICKKVSQNADDVMHEYCLRMLADLWWRILNYDSLINSIENSKFVCLIIVINW